MDTETRRQARPKRRHDDAMTLADLAVDELTEMTGMDADRAKS